MSGKTREDQWIDQLVSEGAELLAGGTVDGLFLSPAVLVGVTSDMSAFNDEIFGPVAVPVPFSTDDEAVALPNDTEYCLSTAVIAKDVDRAIALGDRLQAGLLHINDQTVNDDVVNPFGGVGASGNGTSIGSPSNWKNSPSGSGRRSRGHRRPIRSDPTLDPTLAAGARQHDVRV